MKTKKLLNLILIIPIISIILFTPFFLFLMKYNINNSLHNHLELDKKAHIEQEKQKSKNRVEHIFRYINFVKIKYKNDLKKQKELTIDYIKHIQDINHYIFVLNEVDLNGGDRFARMLINPNKKKILGKYLTDEIKDSKGKQFRKEFLKEIRKNGDSFVDYYYKHPNEKEDIKKTSYFKYQKDFRWIIATGVYYNDIEDNYILKMDYFSKELFDNINKNIIISSLLIIPLIFLLYFFMRQIKYRIEQKDKKLEYLNQVYTLLNVLQSNLIKTSNLNEFGNIFEPIIKKLDVSRLYIFHNYTKNNKIYTSQIFEFNSGDVKPQYNNPELQNVDYKEFGLQRWLDSFKNKDYIEGIVKNFPKIEKDILEPQDIKSILVIPIYYNKELWGFIGFDDCKKDREWSSIEKFVLKTIANGYTNILEKEDYTKNLQIEVEQQIKNIKQKDEIIMQQSKLTSMGEMITNIAHQWRQPLNNINLLCITAVQKYRYNELDDKFIDKFEKKTDDMIQKMSSIIDDFRRFFSPNRSKEIFLPKDAIRNALVMAEASLNNNFIDINQSYNVSTEIKNYKNELEQIVLNLILNSTEAFVKNSIENRKIFINTYEKDKEIFIEIIDNAGGIEQNIMAKIFDPYFTTKFQNQGTGIGLYMSKVMVEQHIRGSINIDNFEDGVKATITIPKD